MIDPQSESLDFLVLSEIKLAQTQNREEWNTLEYYLLSLGASIGFGCVWRFCYLLYDGGGGAFLLPYILMNIILIYPVMTMFVTVGQFSKLGMAQIYRNVHPKYIGLGYVKCVYSVIIAAYYNYLLVYCLVYLAKSLFGELSWVDSDPAVMIENLTLYFKFEILDSNQSGKVVLSFVFAYFF